MPPIGCLSKCCGIVHSTECNMPYGQNYWQELFGRCLLLKSLTIGGFTRLNPKWHDLFGNVFGEPATYPPNLNSTPSIFGDIAASIFILAGSSVFVNSCIIII